MHATASRFVLLLFLLPCALLAQPDRITAPIDARRTVVLQGNVHPRAQPRFDQGPVEPAFRIGYITLMLKKTAAQQAALEQLLQQQQDPASPNYHDWLTPEQYADRFGLSQNDLDKISAWLRSEGFTVEYTARGRNWLAFSGTAGQVRAAFHTEIHRYRVDGEMHFAAAAEPSVPASLEPLVAGFLGLDDFYPKAPKRPLPAYTSGTGIHSLVPDDLATIYDIGRLYQTNINGTNIDGTGQKMVVVGQSAVDPSDIQGFRTKYNLPSLSLQTIPYGSNPGITSSLVEADIDLEWAGAVAQNAALIYVYGPSASAAASYAIDNNLAPVISESFGLCEAQRTSLSLSYRSEAQKASAQGITWLAASGDAGAADCDSGASIAAQGLAVEFPASIPEVTAVGGTEFNEGGGRYWNTTNGPNGGSAISYIPEMAWNDTTVSVSVGQGLSATGGGASFLYPKPAWQTGLGVPSDGARDLPDISLTAGVYNGPYNVYAKGSWGLYGGTSASTPVFAGIVTLLNQYLVAKGVQSKPGVGNINPTLYHLAQSAPNAFHDITAGNNVVPCTQGTPNCTTGQLGYSAGPGYDLATGLGSVDAYNLVTQWYGGPASATTTTVTANPTSILTTTATILTATVSAGSATPTGSVFFTLGGTVLGTPDLSSSGGAATALLRVYGSQLGLGNNSMTASYGGSTGFGASSGSVTVSVSVPPTSTTTTVTANPTSISASASTVLTATVKAASGSITPTGSVTFALGITSLGTANLTGSGGIATASLSVSGSRLTAGNNTITASYGASNGFIVSSGSVTVTLTVPVVATTTTVTANPTSIAVGGSTALTATVTAASGSTTPTGSVSFTLGSTSLGAANLSGSGSTATASLTVNASQLTIGNNTITASYGGSTGFSASSASVTVNVSVPTVPSTVVPSVAPNPVFQQAPDADGYTFLYTVRLSEIAGTAATLTGFTIAGADYSSQIQSWFGSASIPANGTISASLRDKLSTVPVNRVFGFGGTDASGSKWTQQITVPFLGQQSSAAMVLSSFPATVLQNPNADPKCQYYQRLNLQEQNGYEVQLTRFLAGGSDESSTIASWFGSWRLAPFGSLEAGLCWNISNPPKTLAYEVDGTDTAGNKVTAALSVPFQSPVSSPGALTVSKSSVAMSASPSQSAATTVNVNVPSGQPWTVSVFPASQKTGWLVVFPPSGTGPVPVNLVAAAPGLANGAYTATLVFQSANTTPQFVNVPVTFTIGASTTTSIGGVANGASFAHVYAPGMVLSVFGTNLTNSTQTAYALPLPLTMAGVSATVNGVAAPLYGVYALQQQLNIQIPYETATGTALLAVSNNGQVATYSFPVSASAPGIYLQPGNAITPNASGSRGQIYTLFITGAGEVSPPVATGAAPTGAQVPVPLLPVSMTIGGVAAHTQYVGIPVWSVGTLQINFTVPPSAPLGVEPVVVTVGSAASAAANFTVSP